MNTWLALLRGVNVNGITIKMADLRTCLTDAGLTHCRTVLASGNAVFSDGSGDESSSESNNSPAHRAELKTRIETALRERFGYDAWIVLVEIDELRRVVEKFPFHIDDPAIQPYVVFGSDQQALDELLQAAPDLDASVEAIERGAGVIYWRCPKGASTDTPFAKLAAKPRFRTSTTTRNLRTLEKVLAAAD